MKKIAKFLLIFAGTSIALLLAIPIAVHFYREIPNTPDGKMALQRVTGINPTEVSWIYYDYCLPDFHGDDGHYFRFNYPDKEWMDRFISSQKAEKQNVFYSGLVPQNKSWWDVVSYQEFLECYKISGSGYMEQYLWVNSRSKLAYINYYDH
jgi:hypothetical protein